MIQWRFPPSNYGDIKGINDSGTSIFRGTPLVSLAREICQNSLDAARGKTVKIEFNSFSVDKTVIPGINVLQETFNRCRDYWHEQRTSTTSDFFDHAIAKINACDKIEMLRISDFFTSGLLGSQKEKDADWPNLTKSSGVSDKKSTAGGSFGIGKFATFACSDFATVFYSTADEQFQTAYQGVARLVTFESDSDGPTTGVGYYGQEKNTPVLGQQLNFDPKFSRKSTDFGTDIFILGYRFAGDKWENKIIVSVLDGFLGAIFSEKLIVKVGNITISKRNLDSLIAKFKDDLTGFSGEYYEVLKSNKTFWADDNNFEGLGRIRLGLLFPEKADGCRRVAMIRKTGMKILDRDRLAGFINFSGVMFLEGDQLNAKLRAIENPEHTAWEPQRSNDPSKYEAIIKALRNFIKDKINEFAGKTDVSTLDPFGLGSLLPDEIELNNQSDQALKIQPTENDNYFDKIKFKHIENIDDIVTKIETTILSSPRKENRSQFILSDYGDFTYQNSYNTSAQDEAVVTLDYTSHNINSPYQNNSQHVQEITIPETLALTKPFNIRHPKLTKRKKLEVSNFVILERDYSHGQYTLLIESLDDSRNTEVSIFLMGETLSVAATITSATTDNGERLKFASNTIRGITFLSGMPSTIHIQLELNIPCAMDVSLYSIGN